MEMALGCDGPEGFQAIADRIASLLEPSPPRGVRQAIAKGRELLPLLRIGPRRRRRGRCQQVVRLASRGQVDLTRLPLLKCWPLDGDPEAVGFGLSPEAAGTAAGEGRYITFAGMHTIHADDAQAERPTSHNIGMYRAQLPIAICLGGEPVLPYAATAPLPPGLSELLMAGFLNGGGIPMVRAKTVPLWVPANSEIVIEGLVSTACGPIGYDPRGGEPLGTGAVFEGPFGDHTGFYSLPDRYPLVNVTAVTHRRRAIFPAIVVGPPPQEDYYLGKATERIFLPLLRTLIPDIADYHLPLFGCFHNCVVISIRKDYPLQARRVMHAVWGAGQMAWTKLVIVVDDTVNVHDETAVLEAVFRRCHFGRDIELVAGPLDILDHAAPGLGAGNKLGIDATTRMVGEEVNGVALSDGPAPPGQAIDAELLLGQHLGRAGVVDLQVPPFGGGRCVFIAVDKTEPGQGVAAIEAIFDAADRTVQEQRGPVADFVVAVDTSVDLRDRDAVLFHLCANSDPARDRVLRGHRLGFDATAKRPGEDRHGLPVRPFPPLLIMDDTVRQAVDANAAAYGLASATE
jgi:4-hydroxy-3-polyprenylbenzoate decarboxylase